MREKEERSTRPHRDRGPVDPDELAPHLRERLYRLVPRLIELGLGCVHSAERADDGGVETAVDCAARIPVCRSVCCTFRFALTEEEVAGGLISWNPARPYFIGRGEDGYCLHHDRATGGCLIWEQRPLRCRRYDCRRESSFWVDDDGMVLREGTFDHLGRGRSGEAPGPGEVDGKKKLLIVDRGESLSRRKDVAER